MIINQQYKRLSFVTDPFIRGGLHTWVYSKGKIYEVHWDKIGAGLYEATPITKFSWLSGAVVVPPDQKHRLTFSSKLKCTP